MYPFGVPGAVNVTAGDLARLQPEEFLNDTLIEFGLKSVQCFQVVSCLKLSPIPGPG